MTEPFPTDFLWGVAASSYQVEGAAAEGGRGPSIWDTFAHTPGNTKGGETGDVGVDHYHRFREDVSIMADLGVDAYRFSISWPRLIPDGTGAVNPEGVAFYRNLCEELAGAGIVPLATLYHWDLPQVLQDRGGWMVPESVEWFATYAAAAKEALGGLVQLWTTHNEPWCAAFLGHGSGVFAPGVSDPASAFTAAHHLMLGHHRATQTMRERSNDGDRFGIVLNLIPARPATDAAGDVEVAAAADAIHNHLFVETALRGRYPEAIERLHARFGLDEDLGAEMAAAHTPVDFLGVNYYNINRFRRVEGSPGMGEFPGADGVEMTRPPGDLTEMGWGVEPEGLADVLGWISEDYPELPLYVTENGATYPDEVGPDGRVEDNDRIDYLRSHIQVVGDAVAAGVDVRGYFAWSLLDNFEWAEGYSKRFGLVRVDYETLDRTIKASGRWYRDFIAARRSNHTE